MLLLFSEWFFLDLDCHSSLAIVDLGPGHMIGVVSVPRHGVA